MIKKIFTFLILMFFIPFMVNAEELKMDWQKNLGGNEHDSYSEVFQTSDDEFIVYFNSSSSSVEGLANKGFTDSFIFKYDGDGNILLKKSWGGNSNDTFSNIIQTSDGGFIVCGASKSSNLEGITNKGDSDAILIKYDANFNVVWQKNWGGSSADHFKKVIQTSDGGYIVSGFSSSTNIQGITNKGYDDGVIVKFDKNGNMLWQKNWGGSSFDEFEFLFLTSDNNVVAVGYFMSSDVSGVTNKGIINAMVVKYDLNGNMKWQKSYGGNSSDRFSFNSFIDDNGGFLLYLNTSSNIDGLTNKGGTDSIIVKYDKDGNISWQKSWGGNGSDTNKLIETKDGGYIAYGYSKSTNIEGLQNKGDYDAIIIKYDKDFNVIWQKNWGGNGRDYFDGALVMTDGSFIVFGDTYSTNIEGLTNMGDNDVAIVKFDKNGNLVSQTSWGGSSDDSFSDCFLTLDGGIIFFGDTASSSINGMTNNGSYDISIVKFLIEYSTNVLPTDNGSVELERNGKNVVLTVKPNNGYDVKKVFVKDSLGNDINITKIDDEKYTFELKSDVSIGAEFVRVFKIDVNDYINGKVEILKTDDNKVEVTLIPDKGYVLDKISIRDSLNNDVNITINNDGIYTFDLISDVSIEVLFKEEVVNPKTGVIDVISTLLIGFIISFIGFILVKRNCYGYDL